MQESIDMAELLGDLDFDPAAQSRYIGKSETNACATTATSNMSR